MPRPDVDDVEVLVLDDASTDRTRAVADDAAAQDPRVRVVTGAGPPPGWLGKTAACDRLAAEATGSVLVFVDADVRLAAHAVAATVDLLRRNDLDLVSPYPTAAGRDDGRAPRPAAAAVVVGEPAAAAPGGADRPVRR